LSADTGLDGGGREWGHAIDPASMHHPSGARAPKAHVPSLDQNPGKLGHLAPNYIPTPPLCKKRRLAVYIYHESASLSRLMPVHHGRHSGAPRREMEKSKTYKADGAPLHIYGWNGSSKLKTRRLLHFFNALGDGTRFESSIFGSNMSDTVS
jgi:hypothetical protein